MTPKEAPKEFLPLMESLAHLNGEIAKWHSGGYKGSYPSPLIEWVAETEERANKFLEKYKGNLNV